MPIVTCKREACTNQFNRYPCEIKRGTKMYCSQVCAAKQQWSTNTDVKTKICKRCTNNFITIGRSNKAYCSIECRGARRYVTQGYISLSGMYKHPLATTNGVILEHRLVLWNKLGCSDLDCTHKCNWCGVELSWGTLTGIQSDHLDSDKQNNKPNNLVVSCAECNFVRRHRRP